MGVKVKERIPGSGVFWIFINHNGRRKAKKVGSETAALQAKTAIEARLTLGKSALPEQAPSTPTLEDYYKKFRDTYLETAVRKSTRHGYVRIFEKWILPTLGKVRLGDITRDAVEGFAASLVKVTKKVRRGESNRLSKDTIRLYLAPLRGLLNHAVERSIILANPAARIGKLYKQIHHLHEEIQPLTTDEVRLLLGATMKNYPEYFPLFLCAVHTGLRAGELAGLRWGDVDFHGKFIMVRHGLVERRISQTKTGKVRRVDMSDDLLEVLQELKRRRQKDSLADGKNEIPDWVFCNQEGKPADMNNVRNRCFHKSLEKAKRRRIRFHDLRHTFASLLIQNGESLAYVKDQLGHSSIKMTVDVYGHLVPGANRQAVNRLPSLNPKPEESQKNLLSGRNLSATATKKRG